MVSIIIAAYNVEKYIAACIDSVLRLDWPDFELIVVDDGSSDATPSICQEALGGRENARCIRQQNAGAGAARNAGIDAARGEFLMFVDGDDMVQPDLVRKLMERVGPETDIAACCCLSFQEGAEPSPFHFYAEGFTARTVAEKEKLYGQLLRIRSGQPDGRGHTGIGVPWGKLYRTEALRGLRFPDLRRMQDNAFNMYAFARAREIVYLDEPLYRYRRDHISGFRVPPENLADVIRARERFFSEYPDYLTDALAGEFYMERLRYFGNGLKLRASEGGSSAKEKVRALCEWDVYRRLIREPIRHEAGARYRAALLLARLRLYGPLTWISSARERRKGGGK